MSLRPDGDADGDLFLGIILIAGGVSLARYGLRQLRHPIETTNELRESLERRGVPRYSAWVPRDPRPWVPFTMYGGALSIVVGSAMVVGGLWLAGNALLQIVRWRLLP